MLSTCLRIYQHSVTVLVLIFLGGLCGYFFPQVVHYIKPIGDLFLSLIKMMIVPIVCIGIISSASNFGSSSNAVYLGIATFLYFLVASSLAALFGVVVANIFQPGLGLTERPAIFFSQVQDINKVVEAKPSINFTDFILNIIPTNPITALSEGKLLPILFFSLFLGIAISYVKNDNKDILIKSFAVLNDAFLWMIHKIMFLIPVAVFSIMAYFVSETGLEVIYFAFKLLIVIIASYLFWIYIVLGFVIVVVGKVNYINYVKSIFPLQLLALGSSSSLVCLPSNMVLCNKLGFKSAVYGFVLPLGANMHMNGSAIYYAITTIFFAQVFNIEISFAVYVMMIITTALSAITTPGIPGFTLSIVMVMVVANVPLYGLPLIVAIDRILDMFTTTTNVIGNTVCVAVINKMNIVKS
jgi:proton glutamate symport protein